MTTKLFELVDPLKLILSFILTNKAHKEITQIESDDEHIGGRSKTLVSCEHKETEPVDEGAHHVSHCQHRRDEGKTSLGHRPDMVSTTPASVSVDALHEVRVGILRVQDGQNAGSVQRLRVGSHG